MAFTIFRFIPGVLWLDFLDRISDGCVELLHLGNFRLPCNALIAFVWMNVLGEIRLVVGRLVQYLDVRYYRPHRDHLYKTYWAPWPARFGWFLLTCLISYYLTFEFAEDFPELEAFKRRIQNEDRSQQIEELVGGEEQEPGKYFLTAHVFCQRLLMQAEAIVWIMGTFFSLHRRRFWFLVVVTSVVQPLASFVVTFCGNFALWLMLGMALCKAFDLTPPPPNNHLGLAGCVSSFFISTIYWRKFGTMEILLACGAAIGGEILFWKTLDFLQKIMPLVIHNTLKSFCLARGKYDPNNPNQLANRIWAFINKLFASASSKLEKHKEKKMLKIKGEKIAKKKKDAATDTIKKSYGEKSKQEKDSNKPEKESAASVLRREEIYTRPSLYYWIAMSLYWAAVGIKYDG